MSGEELVADTRMKMSLGMLPIAGEESDCTPDEVKSTVRSNPGDREAVLFLLVFPPDSAKSVEAFKLVMVPKH